MRIISIDPGYERIGIAILENAPNKEEVLFSKCFKTSPKLSLSERFLLIGEEVKNIIEKYGPKALAIETLFFTTNQKTAMGVAGARGVIIYEGMRAGLKLYEYNPLQIKIAVTGYGKATKEQVIMMTKKLVSIDEKINSDDEIDAIAIGLTCLASEKFKE